jgi:hypothetical protein
MKAERHRWWFSRWAAALVLLLAACLPTPEATSPPKSTVTPTPTSTPEPVEGQVTPTATPTPQAGGVSVTPTPTGSTADACPQVDVVYRLEYVHRVTQHTPGIQVDHTAGPGAAFYFTVGGDGSIDSNDFENLVPISIAGNLEDCVLEGNAELSAEIAGTCADGVARLHIAEHWESVSTTVTCPGQEPQSTQVGGFFSAPEERCALRLEDGATHVLQGETEALAVYYSWTLHE